MDANVLVAAAIGSGAPRRLFDAWSEYGAFDLVLCPLLIFEVSTVLLHRPKVSRRINADTANDFLCILASQAEQAPDPKWAGSITRDPGDDYLVALARDSRAAVIVSGDKDLLMWPEQRPPVVTPAVFESMLAADST